MDLFSQAEHDELAQAILLAPGAELPRRRSRRASSASWPAMPRRGDHRSASLAKRGALIEVRDLDEACAIANRIAPEHLELVGARIPTRCCPKSAMRARFFSAITRPKRWATIAPVRTTCCRPSRTARFSSPLGVYDFQKRSSVIAVSKKGAARLGAIAVELARGEGLDAHARAAEYRMK